MDIAIIGAFLNVDITLVTVQGGLFIESETIKANSRLTAAYSTADVTVDKLVIVHADNSHFMAVCDPVRPSNINEHLLCQIATINTMPSPVDIETRVANIENNFMQQISHLTGQLDACLARNSALEARFVQFEQLDLRKEAAIAKHDEMMADVNIKFSVLK